MTDWAEFSFWVRVGDAWTNVVGDVADLMFIKEEGVGLVPVGDFDPCSTCPCLNICMNSMWQEGRRMGGDFQDSPRTRVFSGSRKTLSVLDSEDEFEVSSFCPRQDPPQNRTALRRV